jgi:hypothetical protein
MQGVLLKACAHRQRLAFGDVDADVGVEQVAVGKHDVVAQAFGVCWRSAVRRARRLRSNILAKLECHHRICKVDQAYTPRARSALNCARNAPKRPASSASRTSRMRFR